MALKAVLTKKIKIVISKSNVNPNNQQQNHVFHSNTYRLLQAHHGRHWPVEKVRDRTYVPNDPVRLR